MRILPLLILALTLPVHAANTLIDHIVSKSLVRGIDTFGCVGDGVTDNTLSLSNAFAANVPLFVPPGVYYVATPLTNSGKAFVNIRGSGTNSVFLSKIIPLPTSLTNWVSQNVITLTNCQNVSIQDVWFDGGVSGQGYSNIWYITGDTWINQQALVQMFNCTNVNLTRVWTTKFHGSVPVLSDGGTPCPDVNYQGKDGPVYLNRCQFVKVVGGGLQVPTFNPEGWTAINCSDVDWSGWTFTRLPSDGFDDTLVGHGASSGLNIYGIESTNVWIHGNLITAHAGSAMNVSAPQGLVIEKNTIVGGTAPFGIFSGEGIDAGQENNQGVWTNYPIIRNLVIRDNQIRNVKSAAILVALNNSGKTNILYQHPIISGNVIDGCYGGVIVDGVADVAILGNTIRRAVQYAPAAWYGTAISMEDMTGGSVVGNLIDGSEQGLGTNLTAAAVFGIVGVGCDNMLIADNVVSNMTTANIYVIPFVDTQDSGHLILDNRSFKATPPSVFQPFQIGIPGLRMGTVEMRGNTHNGVNAYNYTGVNATNLIGDDLFTPTLIPFGAGPIHSSSTGFTYNDSVGSLWVKTNVSAGQRVSIGANNPGLFSTSSHLDIHDPAQAQIYLESSQTNFANISYGINGLTLQTKENGTLYTNTIVLHNGQTTMSNLVVNGTIMASWGFMSISNLATHVTLSGSGTYSTITNWDVSSLNNFTSSAVNTTGGTLTNTFAGWYRISYSVTCTPGNSDTVEVDVGINGVSSDLIAGHQTAANPAKSVSLAGGGIMFLPAGTAVSLRLQNQNSTTISAFDHAQLVIGTP